MKTHVPTDLQEKAFIKVVEAMTNAKKLGLEFYGKSDCLVAYTKEAAEYQNKDFNACLNGCYSVIPYLSSLGVLSDSGADDYAMYLTEEDEKKFNPDGL